MIFNGRATINIEKFLTFSKKIFIVSFRRALDCDAEILRILLKSEFSSGLRGLHPPNPYYSISTYNFISHLAAKNGNFAAEFEFSENFSIIFKFFNNFDANFWKVSINIWFAQKFCPDPRKKRTPNLWRTPQPKNPASITALCALNWLLKTIFNIRLSLWLQIF